MSSIADVFPYNDPVARFVVAMSMARNDVRYALRQAGEACDRDGPELGYCVRRATGHYFEAVDALRHWRQGSAEVRTFLSRVPQDGLDALPLALSSVQRMGRGVLEHSRDRTFHYPYPTSRYQTDEEFEAALKALGHEEVTLVVESEEHRLFRLQFADHVAAALALHKHAPEQLREQFELARDGAVAFVNFATRAWETYMHIRGLDLELPTTP